MKKFEQILWILIIVLILLVLGRIFIRLFPYLVLVGVIAYIYFNLIRNQRHNSNVRPQSKSSKIETESEFEIEDADFEIDDEEDEKDE